MQSQVPDEASVYSLQSQLQSIIDETSKDEQEITDPQAKQALKNSREMIQTLVNRIKETTNGSNKPTKPA